MKRMKVYINGRFTDISSAKVSVSDRGFLYGDGAFETMRAYAGIAFKLDAHIDRLFHSLKVIDIRPPLAKKDLRDAVRRAIKINKLKSAYVRLAVTRGEGRFGIDAFVGAKPNTVIIAKELDGYPEAFYRRGIKVSIARNTRQNGHSPVSGVKSLNFLNYIIARMEAKKRGFDEAILLNTEGYVAEGASSNIFIVKRGRIMTPSPDSGILQGITRDIVIKLARRLKVALEERRVRENELLGADEAFVTNSMQEVVPVTGVDNRKVGGGKPGDVTRLIRIAYQKEVIYDTIHRI
jgi:branched-chain amino acid aminotransferase